MTSTNVVLLILKSTMTDRFEILENAMDLHLVLVYPDLVSHKNTISKKNFAVILCPATQNTTFKIF